MVIQNKTQKKTKHNTFKTSKIKKYIKSTCSTNLKPFEEEYSQMIKINKTNINNELIRVLRVKTVPIKMQPNNDFYTFVNSEWMKYTKRESKYLEEYIVQLDAFRITQNRVYIQLLNIVKEYIQAHSQSRKAKEISAIYNSTLHGLTDKYARQHLNHYIHILDEERTKKEDNDASLWKFLGKMNKNEIISFGLPFVFSLNPDDKHSETYRCFISGPQLSLIDINVYFDDGTDIKYKANYKRHFFKYINTMFNSFFGKNNSYKAIDVFKVEQEILNAMICFSREKLNPEEYYRVSAKEAQENYQFNWVEFIGAYGFKYVPSFFITSSLPYLKCATKLLLKNWKSNQWRTYFIYIYMRQIARFHPVWKINVFEFCAKFMRGQDKIVAKELTPIFSLAFCFNSFLTNEYINHNANPQAIQYVKTIAEDLKIVFRRKIERNTWLQPQTKKNALLKLAHFKLNVGSPKLLREDPLLGYNKDDIWENFCKIVEWRANHLSKLEGQGIVDIPILDWATYPLKLVGSQAYVVNAYYTPTQNAIYIPLGYIQKPFVDLDERGIEYNLSTIGYTLGHEMSHSLDDMGSQYDYKGNLNNWWTAEDRATFKRKQNDVIKQYEIFAKRDGIDFDASPSVGEDLADISGLAICLEYLKDFQDNNKDVIPIKALSFKAFFIYFAVQQRQIISKKAISSQIKTNPHPLDKYRTNVPLSRIGLFRDMYNVKKGDNMFWHNMDTIW
jgi:predicted metalloendopeptidase